VIKLGINSANNDNKIIDTTHSPDKTIEESIEKVLKPLGGLQSFISKNDRVLLKPNFNTGDPYPGRTDKEFLLSLIHLISNITTNLKIIESSMIRLNSKKIIDKIMGDKLKALNIPVITEKDYNFTRIDLKSLGAKYLKNIKLPQQLLEPENKIILVPCLKTHFIAQFTGALKLGVGFMEKKQRIRMHLGHVAEKVAELNLGYKPHLIVMDARKIFVTGGPAKGKVESPQKILAGTNRTAIDISGLHIIQSFKAKNKLNNKDPLEVRTIKRARELNII
jgi:uncharacterized protein (DUF362 family)